MHFFHIFCRCFCPVRIVGHIKEREWSGCQQEGSSGPHSSSGAMSGEVRVTKLAHPVKIVMNRVVHSIIAMVSLSEERNIKVLSLPWTHTVLCKLVVHVQS